MTVEVGTKAIGKTKYIPRAMLTESVPGQIYELEVRTEVVDNPERVIDALQAELPKEFKDLKVKWIRIDGSVVKMQIVGSPFAWSLLLAFIPSILTVVGVIVTLISVFLIWTTVPGWVTGLAVLGLVLTAFGGKIGEIILREIPVR